MDDDDGYFFFSFLFPHFFRSHLAVDLVSEICLQQRSTPFPLSQFFPLNTNMYIPPATTPLHDQL